MCKSRTGLSLLAWGECNTHFFLLNMKKLTGVAEVSILSVQYPAATGMLLFQARLDIRLKECETVLESQLAKNHIYERKNSLIPLEKTLMRVLQY